MPTWVTSADPRSVSAGSRSCCPLLFWFTSAKERLCWPIRHRRTIPFSPISELAVGACGSSDDGCDCDREPGCAVGRFCSCSASHSTRRHSASRRASDLSGVGWPSLCSSNQLAIGRPRSRFRLRVSLLRRACQRLWNCGGRRHDGHNAASHHGGSGCGAGLRSWSSLSLDCSFCSTSLSCQPMFTKFPPGAGFRCSSASLRSRLCWSGVKVGALPSSGATRRPLVWQPLSIVLVNPARPSA
jgi:hypothetical protein